jgi:pyruvate/2-oxoglutarate dehydrogenase complex dihydrolipoamide acyltransferase (E2) component
MCRPQIRVNAKLGALSAAVLIASLVFIGLAPGQTSNLRAFGRVEGAAPTMTIGVAVSGIVRNLLVHEGDRVHKAQTLVQLDCRQIEADVQVREARLAAAQATFDRYRNGSRPDEISVGEAAVRYAQRAPMKQRRPLGGPRPCRRESRSPQPVCSRSGATLESRQHNSRKLRQSFPCFAPAHARKKSATPKPCEMPQSRTLIPAAHIWTNVPFAHPWTGLCSTFSPILVSS